MRTQFGACVRRARFAALLGSPMPTKQVIPSASRRAAATAIISSDEYPRPSVLTRAPGRRRLPPGEARLRRRLTTLAARGSPGPYHLYCALRPRTASAAPGTRGGMGLTQGVSRRGDLGSLEALVILA